ncbi:MAG: helix-turn-helix domain-containing protein [Deltaproteobacteria bacterium]|nr:helix-turn-helix domain-containing protein [Deltaproteobacteria bacterium]
MIDWENILSLKQIRREMALSQSQLATLLGVSPRTVQSCEQGWRKPSPALEKTLLLLRIAHERGPNLCSQRCWEIKNCFENQRNSCLAFRTRQGHLCWLISGNICSGKSLRNWEDKKQVCAQCPQFHRLLGDLNNKLQSEN